MAIRVGVFGAGGRMGATVCGAVAGDPGLDLVAAIDPAHEGETVEGVTIVADPSKVDTKVDVVIDFTRIDAALLQAPASPRDGPRPRRNLTDLTPARLPRHPSPPAERGRG